ncbi:hypothetical protein ACTHQF_00170 [Pedobacter sp. SAFR-022]|uniref:hypothetical protein n=1 Tax=Pedobacter sp. SAFR-022 TaxID=3436861 RepID=UPI003F7F312C
MKNFADFLIELATDPLLSESFQNEPNKAAKKVGLTKEQKELLLSKDAYRIAQLIMQESGLSPNDPDGGSPTQQVVIYPVYVATTNIHAVSKLELIQRFKNLTRRTSM